ncbi:MAG: hypothetical protein CL607_07970 [Anaerolineaceae bacterium]|nr:hypothetical protein [Anaerolineaceae bacterium]
MKNHPSRISIIILVVALLVAFALVPAIHGQSTANPSPQHEAASTAFDYQHPQVEVIVEGLRNPGALALLPDGSLLVAENGTFNDDFSAGISLITADGQIGRVVSGMPSIDRDFEQVGSAAINVEDGMLNGQFDEIGQWQVAIPMSGFNLDEAPLSLDEVIVANTAESLDGEFDIVKDGFRLVVGPTCPTLDKVGAVYAVGEGGEETLLFDDVFVPVDVAQGPDGTIWLLEFAQYDSEGDCYEDDIYYAHSGRLSIITADGQRRPVLRDLNFPRGILPLADGSLYVSEMRDGEILHVTFGDEIEETEYVMPEMVLHEPVYTDIDDVDAALAAVIAEQGLTPYPGQDMRQTDPDLAELGRQLFFDPILSGDRNISCATCHHPALAMADARPLPIGTGAAGLGPDREYISHIIVGEEYEDEAFRGIEIPNPAIGELVPRNSPTILNSALLAVQFWDGRVDSYLLGDPVTTLETEITELGLTDPLLVQALFPVTSQAEMAGETFGDEEPADARRMIVARLMNIPGYEAEFQRVFGDEEITPVQVAAAIAAFERQLIFTESPWDDYMAGDTEALTDQQKRGALLFYGQLNEDVNCSACHSGDAFTDLSFHSLMVPQFGPGKGNGATHLEDYGRANVTFDWRDRYQFRTAPLRNVALTGPYFHSGAYDTLEEVIWHHSNIWAGIEDYEPSQHLSDFLVRRVQELDYEQLANYVPEELASGLPLSEQDVADLVAFLQALTDEAATDLSYLLPETVISGLPLDALPNDLLIASGSEGGFLMTSNLLANPYATDRGPAHWLMIDTSNLQPGTRVQVVLPDGQAFAQEITTQSRYLSTADQMIACELGTATYASSVVVTLPDGEEIRLGDIASNQTITIAIQ